MPDDIITRDSEGQLAVNTVSGTEANVPYNYDDCFTIDTNGRRALRVVGAGGGDSHNKGYYATPEALAEACPTAEAGDYAIVGSTDTVWVWDTDNSQWVDAVTKGQVTPDMIIVKSATMPTASAVPAGAVYQYVGTTTSTYTHGYIYENKTTPVYDSTVEFNPASISGTTVACSGSDFAAFVAQYGSGDIDTIIKGTITYDESGNLLVFVGQDGTDATVCTFQVYTQDYEDAGFTFTGTLADGDVINFSCTITESASYAWSRIDVQPVGVTIDDTSTSSTTATWSASKLNTMIGDVETLLSQI